MRRSSPTPAWRRVLASLPLLALGSTPARAQAPRPPVSDADREAARNLFKQGYDLQAAGSYAEALDRFKRSQEVYPAPTALLHIAECEARLLRLVEAVETYRALAREPLGPGAPPAFVAAQTQGAAELQQIEPRLPHVRVEVTPTGIPNLAVWVDDQPMNVALLGVDRPIDPGDHKIAAAAPGFARAEALAHFEEKQPTRAVTLQLAPGAVVVAPQGPLPPLPPMQAPAPRVVYVAAPPPVTYAPAPPPVYRLAPPPVVAPAAPESRTGLFWALRLGAVYPDVSGGPGGVLATGFSLGGEVNLRFARRFFVGAVVDHGFLGTSASSGPSYSTTNVDAVLGIVTNPDRFGVLFQVGVGYRGLSGSDGTSLTAPEGTIGIGMWIPIGHRVRLVPRIDTSLGSFSGSNGESGVGYAMVAFVLGGYYNLDFAPPSPAVAPPAPPAPPLRRPRPATNRCNELQPHDKCRGAAMRICRACSWPCVSRTSPSCSSCRCTAFTGLTWSSPASCSGAA